jgi:hypothetical protein
MAGKTETVRSLVEFPKQQQLADGLISLSGLVPTARLDKFLVELTLDDLIRLFDASLDDVIQIESLLSLDNKAELDEAERLGKVRCDDRLSRMVQVLSEAGISESVLLQIVWHRNKEMRNDVQTISAIVGEDEDVPAEEVT